jgi:hypothetical protein
MNATDIIRYIDTHCGYYSYFRIVLISHWLLYTAIPKLAVIRIPVSVLAFAVDIL